MVLAITLSDNLIYLEYGVLEFGVLSSPLQLPPSFREPICWPRRVLEAITVARSLVCQIWHLVIFCHRFRAEIVWEISRLGKEFTYRLTMLTSGSGF